MNKQILKEYFFIAIGSFLVAFGIYYFMVPENLATGGVSGLSIVLNNYISIPISFINFFLNFILFILGFIFLGKEFGGKTIFSVIFLSLFMYLMETFFPVSAPITDEILLNLMCGIVIMAIGLSIVFNQNASTGGTDIIAKILNKYFNMDIGKGLMAADVIVVALAFFTYGIQTGIVGAFGWFLNGVVVNYFLDGFSVKNEVVIISKKHNEIKKYIFERLDRGVTLYKAEGGYTNEEKDIIVTILDRREYYILKKQLKTIDPNVFVTVRTVQEVYGFGFSKF
ncbi:YitT family protein [Sedimentibacter hydroxybenzoicus DSM 7310]|uniref:YitT family protein n=1 Tax=Sedimentibacter hydroxybenzoicus DSM 7310 TaxID=1123245 RepID=A0A974GXT5_SEDHY|nr:YitT family protein [Sedimentibacter hydroxybenzoicus DSM 7310]